MKYTYAIFDICGTLYKSNTTLEFLEFYWRRNNKFFLYLFFVFSKTTIGKIIWILLSKFFADDLFRTIAVRTLVGEKEENVDEIAKRYVQEELSHKTHKEIFDLLNSYRNDGIEIILLSASICPVVKAIASELKIERFFCSSLEKKDGNFTGSFLTDIRGRKKDIFLNAFGINNDFVFVTDNKEDLPLLRLSAMPYIVVRHKNKKYWHIKKPDNAKLIEV